MAEYKNYTVQIPCSDTDDFYCGLLEHCKRTGETFEQALQFFVIWGLSHHINKNIECYNKLSRKN